MHFSDINGHHGKSTEEYDVCDHNFASFSGCAQLICGPFIGSVFFLLGMLDITDLCIVKVGCPFERSDHSHVGIVLNLTVGMPVYAFAQEVVIKSRVKWRQFVQQMLFNIQ